MRIYELVIDNIAIKVENLTKTYKLYDNPVSRLKEALHPFRKKYHRDFYALKDVNFEVKKGETVGIIGKNGSGKSTLLKIIAGVLTQTSGNVIVNGRVSSLLELGTGFNPELTGMENIYFSGTIMGYSKAEIDEKVNDILAFADIGEFINQPVKIYSSGMFVRLAFAVAVNINPDILIIDEALAVGDMGFQKKCMEKIITFEKSGKTILFCSHDMHVIGELSDYVIWMNNGKIMERGEPASVISSYVSSLTEFSAKPTNPHELNQSSNPNYFVRNSEHVEILSVELFDQSGKTRNVFVTDENLVFKITYNALTEIEDPNYSAIIFRSDRIPVTIAKTNYHKDLPEKGTVSGKTSFTMMLRNIKLNQGKYTFGISIWDKAKKNSFANNITKEFEIKSLRIVFGPTEEKAVYFPETEWRF